MDQNNIVNFEEAKKLIDKATIASKEAADERRSIFEDILQNAEKINPSVGGFEEFAALMALPDEQLL